MHIVKIEMILDLGRRPWLVYVLIMSGEYVRVMHILNQVQSFLYALKKNDSRFIR